MKSLAPFLGITCCRIYMIIRLKNSCVMLKSHPVFQLMATQTCYGNLENLETLGIFIWQNDCMSSPNQGQLSVK